jgi:V8-like Glu-specific endopeptidase
MPNIQVHPDNVHKSPFNAIVRFKTYRRFSRKPYISTGFFIGPNHILTAGHNFYSKWRKVVSSYASIAEHRGGRIAKIENFHHSKSAFVSPAFNSRRTWNSKNRDDYCLIKLEQEIANQSLFSLPKVNAPKILKGTQVWVAGYPSIKQHPSFNGKDMHWGTGEFLGYDDDGATFKYDVDTAGGNSGGPVFIEGGAGEFVAIGIHVAFGTPSTIGIAKTIDLEVINFTQKHGYQSNEI